MIHLERMRIVSNAPFDQSLPSVVEVSQLHIVAFTCREEVFLLICIYIYIIIERTYSINNMLERISTKDISID